MRLKSNERAGLSITSTSMFAGNCLTSFDAERPLHDGTVALSVVAIEQGCKRCDGSTGAAQASVWKKNASNKAFRRSLKKVVSRKHFRIFENSSEFIEEKKVSSRDHKKKYKKGKRKQTKDIKAYHGAPECWCDIPPSWCPCTSSLLIFHIRKLPTP